MTASLLCPGISLSSLLSQAAGTAVMGTLDDVMMSPVSFSQSGIPSIPHPAQSHTSTALGFLESCSRASGSLFPRAVENNNLVKCKGENKATQQ